MPFDKTFLLRPTPTPAGVDSGTTYTPAITLGTYGTYPNGIIIQVLGFEGFHATNVPFVQLRFPQITSPNPGIAGQVPIYKVMGLQTINNITLLANQFWFKMSETPEPAKINGFNNATLTMAVLNSNDDAIVAGVFLIKIRIIGF
jgi:hypothetical protein